MGPLQGILVIATCIVILLPAVTVGVSLWLFLRGRLFAAEERWLFAAFRLLCFVTASISIVVGVGFCWLAFSGLEAGLFLAAMLGGMIAIWRYRVPIRRAVRGSI